MIARALNDIISELLVWLTHSSLSAESIRDSKILKQDCRRTVVISSVFEWLLLCLIIDH